MIVEGSFQVRRDRESVFAFFTNARELIGCLDDPHTVEVADRTHFSGTVITGVAFIRGTFRFSGEYRSLEPPSRVVAALHGTGLGSGLDATLATDLAESSGATTVRWNADLAFSGPLATVGDRIVRSTVDKKTKGLFDRARQRLEGGSS
jgi:carbon monoxide dehydrogenase subunit G